MSITATSVAAAASAWAGVVDFPAPVVIGLVVVLSVIGMGIALFGAKRAARGRR